MCLISGRDSKIRSAEIQLPSKNTVLRSINYLYPLELPVQASEKSNKDLTECCHNDDAAETNEQNLNSSGHTTSEFGRRKTFIDAQRAIHTYLKDNCCVIIFCPSRECQEDI